MKKSLKFLFFLMGLVLAVSFFGCEQLAKYEDLITGEIPGTIPGDGDGEGEPGDGEGGETPVTVVNLTLDLNGGTYRNSSASLSMKLNVGDNIKDYMYPKNYDIYSYPLFMNPEVTGALYNGYTIRKRAGNEVYWLNGFTRTKDGNDFVTTVEARDNNTTVYAKWVPAKDILPVYYDMDNAEKPVKVIFRPEDYDLPFDASEITAVKMGGHFTSGDYWKPESVPGSYCLQGNPDGTWSQNYSESEILGTDDNPVFFKFVVMHSEGELWLGIKTSAHDGLENIPYEFLYLSDDEITYNPPDFKFYPLRIMNFFEGKYVDSSTSEMVNVKLDGNGGFWGSDKKPSKDVRLLPKYPVNASFGFSLDGYLLKGWSTSSLKDEFPSSVEEGMTLYASWVKLSSIETKPVVKESNGYYTFIFNPVLYTSFIGKSLDTSLDIYIRGDFNSWLFDESNGWVKDPGYKMDYNPDTKDYRITLPESVASIDNYGSSGAFKFYINDDDSGKDVGWFGAAEYRKSEVELDASYYKSDNNFKIPDSL